ncbi:MAG TPA: cytochrome c biogenesis protein CcsA [Phycisphaerae bacterium]|nr:cytochrome c biogenesis protein CcsA [Phycisphaerae bacterium]
MTEEIGLAQSRRPRSGIVAFLGSTWTGIASLVLILLYASIGSGLAPVRGALEMTEMQVFEHWFFVALVAFFLISLVVSTLTRIKFSWMSAGALMAHAGLVLLTVGAFRYFAYKVEGDVLLMSPRVELCTVDGKRLDVAFLAEKGQTWEEIVPVLGGVVRFEVLDTQPAANVPVASATVKASIGDAPPVTVALGMADRSATPVGGGLALQLRTFAPQRKFYDKEVAALYFGPTGGELQFTPIPGLPLHRERYTPDEGELYDVLGRPVPSKRTSPHLNLAGLKIPTGWFETWRMPIKLDTAGLPFDVEVTGYVPYVAGTAAKPVIQPLQLRRPGQVREPSAIRLKLTGRGAYEGWSESRWCYFAVYPRVDANAAAVIGAPPKQTVLLPDGKSYDLLYSRLEHDLGASLIPLKLSVKHMPGGRMVESWRSDFLVQRGQSPPTPAAVFTNQTYSVPPWTLFQANAAGDGWTFTGLGVGNRRGMLLMALGSVLTTLGCIYAFYIKPIIKQRRRAWGDEGSRDQGIEGMKGEQSREVAPRSAPLTANSPRVAPLLMLLAFPFLAASAQGAEPFAASQNAVALDRQIDWRHAKLIVVQDAGRYKTLEAFARERVSAMYGTGHLPGLSPCASLFELLFNGEQYDDVPLVKVRERDLRIDLTEHMAEVERLRVRQSGYLTPRELRAPAVQKRIRELLPINTKTRALNRMLDAQATARDLKDLMLIVPRPNAAREAAWFTPDELRTNAALAVPEGQRLSAEELARRFGPPALGISPTEAARALEPWLRLQEAWQRADAPAVQTALANLTEVLPALAAPGVYPPEAQRQAEAHYYETFTSNTIFSRAFLGPLAYLLGGVLAVIAFVTRWPNPRRISLLLMALGLIWHAYMVGLRWYVLGRIPVANMFEAITAAAWGGIAIALLAELFYRTGVFLIAGNAAGFSALTVASFVLPGGGAITSMMGILDNIMLRLHTVMIVLAYALIFIGAVIAVIYLLGYYYYDRLRHAEPLTAAREARLGRAVALPQREVPVTGGLQPAPILAGAAPSDIGLGRSLPGWLHNTDWSHLIVLNMAFILLFVGGVVLGAVWADFSWGRPWGWDPKETFALNTWLIYAVLLHVRYVVRNKGLWTAWLSIAGCAMMLFNWFVVNYYIVGLHSYA